jgi:hypothetical protein
MIFNYNLNFVMNDLFIYLRCRSFSESVNLSRVNHNLLNNSVDYSLSVVWQLAEVPGLVGYESDAHHQNEKDKKKSLVCLQALP